MIKNIGLVLTAVLPVIILLKFVFDKDKIEKEPLGLLIKLFCLGFLSVIVSSLLSKLLPSFDINCYRSFIKIALIEEFAKWITIYLVSWKSKEFNYVYDAIVYSIFVSLGFACFENILYVLNYGITTSVFRGFLSVPCHAFYAVYMGYFLGKAKSSGSTKFKLLSILVPTLLHGVYDYLLLSESLLLYFIFVIYVVVLYNQAIKIINSISKNDHRLIN